MRKLGWVMEVLVVLAVALPLAALGAGPIGVLAQGGGPADALVPSEGWQPVAVGQRVWYAFEYSGDRSQIMVRMGVSPKDSVALSVWTRADIDAWSKGGPERPVGRGSANPSCANDLVWSGNFNQRGTYYVALDQKGSLPGSYRLSITGKGVTFSAPPAARAGTGATVAAIVPVVQVAGSSQAMGKGNGPSDPLSATNAWTAIGVGQRAWYGFSYTGDRSQITVRSCVSPKDSVAFSIWTPADLEVWAKGQPERPVGRGTANVYCANDLVWSGNFNQRGTYYVVVDQKGATPGNYRLSITGKGVTP